MKKDQTFHLLLLAAAALFFVVGMGRALAVREDRTREKQSREIREAVHKADAVQDSAEALELYLKIRPCPPEVQLRILQRQWLLALERLREIRRMRNDLSLQGEAPLLFGRLGDLLEEMSDRCLALLSEREALSAQALWRTLNLHGAVKLLNAFAVVETERNTKKAGAMLREAVALLKAAIEAVDTLAAAEAERNVPRWNLELLASERIVARVQLFEADTQRQLDLRNNLEAILPNQGGYAPGEPVSRKVLK